MRSLQLNVFVLFCCSTLFAQPSTSWNQYYGGSDWEYCYDVLQTSDGGYVLAGESKSFGAGSRDFWIVKTSPVGSSRWNRTFGGSRTEYCRAILQTETGEFLLAGSTESFGSRSFNFWLVKADSNGDSLWSRTYGDYGLELCNDLIQTDDDGFILAGSRKNFGEQTYDFWLVKTNSNGDSLWSRTFGGEESEECFAVQQTADGGFILAGNTQSYGAGGWDMWLVKTDSNGNSLWSRSFGGAEDEMCYAVLEAPDGGFLLAGYTESFDAGDGDFWLLKTDSSGDSLWSYAYGGIRDDECKSMQLTADGGIVLAGESYSFTEGFYDYWLIKTYSDGRYAWGTAFQQDDSDYCQAVIQTADSGFALVGHSLSGGSGHYDYWIIKTNPDPILAIEEQSFFHPSSYSLSAYPNPFNSELTLNITGFTRDVRISMFDLLGREVTVIHDGLLTTNLLHYSAPVSLSAGLYFLRANDQTHSLTTKVVYLK